MQLQGKLALIAGGATGIREGIARPFASEGARVVIADISAAKGEALAASIAGAGGPPWSAPT